MLANELDDQLNHPTWPGHGGFFAVNIDTLRNTLILVIAILIIAVVFRVPQASRADATAP